MATFSFHWYSHFRSRHFSARIFGALRYQKVYKRCNTAVSHVSRAIRVHIKAVFTSEQMRPNGDESPSMVFACAHFSTIMFGVHRILAPQQPTPLAEQQPHQYHTGLCDAHPNRPPMECHHSGRTSLVFGPFPFAQLTLVLSFLAFVDYLCCALRFAFVRRCRTATNKHMLDARPCWHSILIALGVVAGCCCCCFLFFSFAFLSVWNWNGWVFVPSLFGRAALRLFCVLKTSIYISRLWVLYIYVSTLPQPTTDENRDGSLCDISATHQPFCGGLWLLEHFEFVVGNAFRYMKFDGAVDPGILLRMNYLKETKNHLCCLLFTRSNGSFNQF